MIKSNELINKLDEIFPNASCELNYNKDYELLIAVILSAQTTDKKVNQVTKELFKYSIDEINKLPISKIEAIIKPIGTYKRKAIYIHEVSNKLINECQRKVPNDRVYLESLPGVGRKTTNVVLSNLFNVPAIAVDTHVARVSKRLGIVNQLDDVKVIEKKLMNYISKTNWIKFHHQMVLFGRYICQSKNPKCMECILYDKCLYENKKKL